MKTIQQEELENVGRIEANTLVQAECLYALRYIADGSVDAVIADPPYG